MQQATLTTTTTYGACTQRLRPVVRPPRCRCTPFAACREVRQAETQQQPAPAAAPPTQLWQRLRNAAVAGALSAALALSPLAPAAMQAHAQTAAAVDYNTPVIDLAKVVPGARLEPLQQQLRDLESETGWRVRMLTRFGPSGGPSDDELRSGWQVDDKTIVVFVDPSSPNILNFKFGREVRQVLRPQFFTELQGRFGNLFFVREKGESAAVMDMMGALTTCLERGGCFVVPGLTSDHYYFTLAVSIAGGVIAGAAARLEPQGFVQRRWVWVLLFAPLWGTLFVNFGLGPVVTRTSDILPVAGNVAAFAATAIAVGYQQKVAQFAGLSTDEADS